MSHQKFPTFLTLNDGKTTRRHLCHTPTEYEQLTGERIDQHGNPIVDPPEQEEAQEEAQADAPADPLVIMTDGVEASEPAEATEEPVSEHVSEPRPSKRKAKG